MKTTIDIPDDVLKEAMKHSQAATKREAVVTALEEYNRRRRMVRLLKHFGTSEGFFSPEELEQLRSMD
jgi:Arc/MetJ family transcription regulator